MGRQPEPSSARGPGGVRRRRADSQTGSVAAWPHAEIFTTPRMVTVNAEHLHARGAAIREFNMKRRDRIIEELHRVREDIGKAHDFDVHRIARRDPSTRSRGHHSQVAQTDDASKESFLNYRGRRTPQRARCPSVRAGTRLQSAACSWSTQSQRSASSIA